MEGYVYLMRHRNGLVKIGFSKAPKAREKTLQAEDPQLKIIFYFSSNTKTESRLHRIFKEIRIRGEWFQLDQNHIDWIRLLLWNRRRPKRHDKRAMQIAKAKAECERLLAPKKHSRKTQYASTKQRSKS